jgi:hypothetical protein
MKTAKQILSFGMLLILFGCVTLYKPNAIHSPLLKEKGELNTSASLGLSGCGLFNLQSAYGISDNTGVMIDGMYHNRHSTSADSSVENLNMFFGEAGAGYFTTFGDSKNWLFQWYTGGGYGITRDKISNADQPNPEVSSKYFNIFTQPGMAFTSKHFEAAFDVRTNYVRLFKIHAYLYEKFEWWNTNFNFYSDTTIDFVNLEPAVTFKAGGEKLKGVVQLGLTIPAINSNAYFMVNNSSLLIVPLIKFSIGVNYTFQKKFLLF